MIRPHAAAVAWGRHDPVGRRRRRIRVEGPLSGMERAVHRLPGPMRGFAVSGALALLVSACAAEESASPLGHAQHAIVGGTASPATQDATVLISEAGRATCSGVLVAPNLVLTARHCVTDFNPLRPCGGPLGASSPPSALAISVGPRASPTGFVARGARLFLPEANELCGADIALIGLDDDIEGVEPAKLRFTPPAAGALATAVGYGENEGVRTQRNDVKILAVGPSRSTYRTESGFSIPVDVVAGELSTTESTCYGDSGGPLFDESGHVVGVASRGLDERCRDRPALWTTLGAHERLIEAAALAVGHPLEAVRQPGANANAAPSGRTPPADAGAPTGAGASSDDGAPTGEAPKEGELGCASAPQVSPATSPLMALFVGLVVVAARRRRARCGGGSELTPPGAGRRGQKSAGQR